MAKLFATLLPVYLLLGLAFGIAFVIWGIHKVDEDAVGTGLGFRLIILPGMMAFWPVMLLKWLRARKA